MPTCSMLLLVAADGGGTGPRWGRAVALVAAVVMVLVVREVIIRLIRSGGPGESGGHERLLGSDEEGDR